MIEIRIIATSTGTTTAGTIILSRGSVDRGVVGVEVGMGEEVEEEVEAEVDVEAVVVESQNELLPTLWQ
jgi:hypothetical protein